MEILPGEWVVQGTYWVSKLWGPTQGIQAPFVVWKADETNRRAVGSLNSAHKEHTHVFLLPKQGREVGLKTAPVAGKLPMIALVCATA